MKWILLCFLAPPLIWAIVEVWMRYAPPYHDHYRAFLRQQKAKQRWKEILEANQPCVNCNAHGKPICDAFHEEGDEEGRASHRCTRCGHDEECHAGPPCPHGASYDTCPDCRH